MKITLEQVREILRKSLGFDSFVASFITSVEEDDKATATACISNDGRLKFNSKFVRKHITSKEDAFCLIFHEVLHPLFNHYMYARDVLSNIACDAVINAVISLLYSEASGKGSLFRKIYAKKGIEGILRLGSDLRKSRFDGLYRNLYGDGLYRGESLSTGEVIQALKVLVQKKVIKGLLLIGSHTFQGEEQTKGSGQLEDALSADILAGIASDIKKSLKNSRQPGHFDGLFGLISQVLKTHLSLKKKLLKDFLIRSRINRFKAEGKKRKRVTSPLPLRPSKRDLVLLASGIYPLYFHNHLDDKAKRKRGIAIYLDVSGSVNDDLPEIIGILRSLRNEMERIYLFSNKVEEASFAEVISQGKVKTTWGTDFDCVAESILKEGYEKAVVITDGWASMKKENLEALKKRKVKTLTILLSRSHKEPDCFKELGSIVKLKDALI